MKGRHDTQLVYVRDGGEIDVGVVACVPRKGEIVLLHMPGAPIPAAFVVCAVGWSVHVAKLEVYSPAPSTVVRVSLTRCE